MTTPRFIIVQKEILDLLSTVKEKGDDVPSGPKFIRK